MNILLFHECIPLFIVKAWLIDPVWYIVSLSHLCQSLEWTYLNGFEVAGLGYTILNVDL